MGELLSAQEIILGIDQAGNKDGVATLEEIQPHPFFVARLFKVEELSQMP